MHSVDRVVLEGRYVRLDPLTPEHGPGLLAAAQGPRESFRFTPVPDTAAGMQSYVKAALADQEAGSRLAFATVEKAGGRVVGCTSFLDIQFWPWPAGSPHQRGQGVPDVVEIGATWLSSDTQRTGINTEAKLLMLSHAFETWRVRRVCFKTDRRNQKSRDAILRLGARFDGVLRAARIAADGEIRDSAYYSIVDGEWPEVRERLRARLR